MSFVRQYRVVLASALALICSCSEAHQMTPRPASGCANISAAIPDHYIWQTAEDGGSCVRLDVTPAETAGTSVLGVTVSGPYWLDAIRRATGPCETYSSPRFIAANTSATRSNTAAGTLNFTEGVLNLAEVQITFGPARDGSLGSSEMWFVAENVALTDICPVE